MRPKSPSLTSDCTSVTSTFKLGYSLWVARGSCVWQTLIVTLFPAPPYAGVAFGSVLACDLPGQGAVQTQETATFCTAGVLPFRSPTRKEPVDLRVILYLPLALGVHSARGRRSAAAERLPPIEVRIRSLQKEVIGLRGSFSGQFPMKS